jgi:hypothetical protein
MEVPTQPASLEVVNVVREPEKKMEGGDSERKEMRVDENEAVRK